MLVEAADRLAEQVRRCDVTSEQKEDTEANGIFHAQALAIHLSSQQLAHHIVAGLAASLFQHSLEVVGHLFEEARKALHLWIVALLLLGLKDLRITELASEQSIGPLFEQRAIGGRNAQHFRNDHRW